MTTTRVYEGVTYYRYRVTLRFTNPKRPSIRWTRWSPNEQFLSGEVRRELEARGIEPKELKSATIEQLEDDETPIRSSKGRRRYEGPSNRRDER